MDADPFCEEAVRLANPAFGDFQNAVETMAMAEDARRMPSREAEYRNLILNQRVDMNQPFITRTVWETCGGEPDDIGSLPIYAGLDLSEVRDLTAFVALGVDGDTLHCKPTFWLPAEGLADKARTDRVPYDLWHKQGLLETCPGPTVDFQFVAEWLVGFIESHDVRKIAFDRWNFRHLKPWLVKAGLSDERIESTFEEMGQGFQSMSPALRDLEVAILNRKLRHGGHPVLSMCAANATVQMDPAGNRKLSKAKSHGRIDGMVALAMAAAVAVTEDEIVPTSPWDDETFVLAVG
jgi:phage terminase large subunit-like protein